MTGIYFIGGTPPTNVFWSEDQTPNRHLAPQFHPVPPTSWFGQNAFPIATTMSTNTTGNGGNTAGQGPVNVPAQTPYKLAQDPITGQLLLLSSGKGWTSSLSLITAHTRWDRNVFNIKLSLVNIEN